MITWFSRLGGYDAIDSRNRRRGAVSRVQHEDRILRQKDREKLAATTQDSQRNFELVAWMVRKHLDYVTRFSFQCKTGVDEVDDNVEAFMNSWGSRYRCHTQNTHGLRRMLRMAEARRIVDGDIGLIKVSRGRHYGKIQVIEGDRIRDPQDPRQRESQTWVNGVRISDDDTPTAYNVARRGEHGSYESDREVRERDMILHAYWDATHRFDQCRGISPIAAALNRARDLYEGFDYTLAKIKVAAMFGLKITRETSTDSYGDETETSAGKYDVDFGRGPVKLELDPGDDAAFLESETPSTQTSEYLDKMTMLVCKSLDLPYSFYDEAHTNFYGSRGGLMQYIRSAKNKQEDCADVLNEVTAWRLGLAVAYREVDIGRLDYRDIVWEWVPEGVPWWDPAKEVNGHLQSIGGGLNNPQAVCRMTGTDYYDNIDQIAAAKKYAEERGVHVEYGTSSSPAPVEPQDMEAINAGLV